MKRLSISTTLRYILRVVLNQDALGQGETLIKYTLRINS